jgi:hypothetical protein
MSDSNKKYVNKWIEDSVSGAKRANLDASTLIPDWFVGYGKDESCQFEGTWWDMICFARNVLASENTMLAAPEYYRPEWANDNYCGESIPYKFVEVNTQ